MVERHEFRRVSGRLAVGIGAWNVLQNVVFPPWTYTPLNTAAAAGTVALADRLGLARGDLGLGRGTLRRGLLVGGGIGAAIIAATAAASTARGTRLLFRDDRAAGAPPTEAAFQVLIRIPLGTALFEEIVFRGLLLGWLVKGMPTRRAVAISSMLFGLWHVIPTWQTLAMYQGGAVRERGPGLVVGAEMAAVTTTSLVGGWFCWLRLRSGSLLAPVVVHAAANVAGYTAAWLVGDGADF